MCIYIYIHVYVCVCTYIQTVASAGCLLFDGDGSRRGPGPLSFIRWGGPIPKPEATEEAPGPSGFYGDAGGGRQVPRIDVITSNI